VGSRATGRFSLYKGIDPVLWIGLDSCREVGSLAIGRVSLLKRIREFGKRIRHFECTVVYGGIYI